MAKCWFHHSESGYQQVLRDHGTQQECLAVAQSIAASAEGRGGGPYSCDVIPGKNRAHARASTATTGAYWREVKNRALSHSIPRKGQWSDKHRANWRKNYLRRKNRT